MVDWGSIPAYFGVPAYIGVIALVLTLTVLVRDRRERVRAQADKVAAWVQRGREDNEPHRVVIRNAGDLPCTDLRIWWTVGYLAPAALRFSTTFGADTDGGGRKPRHEHAIGPGETLVLHETHEDCAVRAFAFTDAAGRQWLRRGARLTREGTFRDTLVARVRRTWLRLRSS